MKKEYLTILTNIIGGVESGGQTYGKRKYGAYAGKAANADRKSTRLNSSHVRTSRMPSSA